MRKNENKETEKKKRMQIFEGKKIKYCVRVPFLCV